jgi:hypothetical protein
MCVCARPHLVHVGLIRCEARRATTHGSGYSRLRQYCAAHGRQCGRGPRQQRSAQRQRTRMMLSSASSAFLLLACAPPALSSVRCTAYHVGHTRCHAGQARCHVGQPRCTDCHEGHARCQCPPTHHGREQTNKRTTARTKQQTRQRTNQHSQQRQDNPRETPQPPCRLRLAQGLRHICAACNSEE